MAAEWASRSLRQMVIQQIEDTSRKFGNISVKTSQEYEQHILDKAQSRDDYLQMVARLILHIKEVRGKGGQMPASGAGNQGVSNPVVLGGPGGIPQMVTVGNPGEAMILQQMMSMPQQFMPHPMGNIRPNQLLQHNLAQAEWASPSLRQMAIQQIEDISRMSGNILVKTSQEYEQDILDEAQSRDDYLQMVARLILHIKVVQGKGGGQMLAGGGGNQGVSIPGGPGGTPLMVTIGNPGEAMIQREIMSMPQQLMPLPMGNIRPNQLLQYNLTQAEWASPSLRQMAIQQIEDTLRRFGNILVKTSQEYEQDILHEAQSRDHYLQMVARLIQHIRVVQWEGGQMPTVGSDNQGVNNPGGPGGTPLMVAIGNPGAAMIQQQNMTMPQQLKTLYRPNQLVQQNRKQPCG